MTTIISQESSELLLIMVLFLMLIENFPKKVGKGYLLSAAQSQGILSSNDENEVPRYTRGIHLENGGECNNMFPTNWIQVNSKTLRWLQSR